MARGLLLHLAMGSRRWGAALAVALLVALSGAPPVAAAPGQRARATRVRSKGKAKGSARRKAVRTERSRGQTRRRANRSRAFRRSRAKFARVERFGEKLPALRKKIQGALKTPHADRATAEAAILRIMDRAYVRVGSERFARRSERPSFGAASLRKEHVRVRGDRVTLEFPGKSKVHWKKTIVDPALAKTIKMFLELPGDRLFQYRGAGGRLVPVTARHIREALAPYGGLPKDFRTHHANRLFKKKLGELGKPSTPAKTEKNLQSAIDYAAGELNHTTEVFESNYLDPQNKRTYRESGAAGRGPPGKK